MPLCESLFLSLSLSLSTSQYFLFINCINSLFIWPVAQSPIIAKCCWYKFAFWSVPSKALLLLLTWQAADYYIFKITSL